MKDACTRCGRALRDPQYVEGKPYGPICVQKLFGGTVTARYTGAKQNKASEPKSDPNQLTFEEEQSGN